MCFAYLRLADQPGRLGEPAAGAQRAQAAASAKPRSSGSATPPTSWAFPLWEVVSDPEAVRSLAGRSAKGLLQFCELINGLQARAAEAAPSELVQLVIERSGYLAELIAAGTDEAEDRRRNLNELVNAALQYQEENEEGSLDDFLRQRPWPAMPTARTPSKTG
jgi:superfamily I DNA/RNA helicase